MRDHRRGTGAIRDRLFSAARPTARGPYCGNPVRSPVKNISLLEVLLRQGARFAAVSGVIALLVWLTWVMLDVSHMQSGFTLPY
ncbi:MAG: hypothetical protein ACK587_14425 [Cyanobacteriota bacterium]